MTSVSKIAHTRLKKLSHLFPTPFRIAGARAHRLHQPWAVSSLNLEHHPGLEPATFGFPGYRLQH